MKNKKTICFDFDGVICKDQHFGNGDIWEKPVDGIKELIDDLSHSYNIVILSVRSNPSIAKYYAKGKKVIPLNKRIAEMVRWLKKYKIHYDEIAKHKPPAEIYVDDKAHLFTDVAGLRKRVKEMEVKAGTRIIVADPQIK